MNRLIALACCFVSFLVSFSVQAQESANTSTAAPAAETVSESAKKETATPPAGNSGEATSGDKKNLREANFNLRTTVTGNQEQPRVMYILPWQSPGSPELEMEMLSSQQDAVFGHVERDELQRSLDAAGEFDQATGE